MGTFCFHWISEKLVQLYIGVSREQRIRAEATLGAREYCLYSFPFGAEHSEMAEKELNKSIIASFMLSALHNN